MMTNPFTFGSRIQHPKEFVGRRVEREQIIARLNGTQPEGSAIVGERRIGKSSLLYYLAHPRDDETLLPLNTRRVIYLSAAAGHCNTPEQFRVTLIKSLLEQCKLDRRKKIDKRLDELQQELANQGSCSWPTAREVLENIPFHPVICLDEFEALLNKSFNDIFFNALRNWANEGLLSWVTASAKPLEELRDEKGLTSPFFNLLATIPLGGLTDDEVNDLLKQADTTSHPFTDKEKRMVKRLAGNNPYHLQMVAWRLWQMKAAGQRQEIKAKALRQYLCQQPNPPALCLKKPFPPFSWLVIALLLMIIMILLALLSWQAPHFVESLVKSIKYWINAGWNLMNKQGTALGTFILLLTFITIVFRVLKERRGVLESLQEIWKRFIGGS